MVDVVNICSPQSRLYALGDMVTMVTVILVQDVRSLAAAGVATIEVGTTTVTATASIWTLVDIWHMTYQEIARKVWNMYD